MRRKCDFSSDNERSNSPEEDAYWIGFFTEVWPDAPIEKISDLGMQKAGVDWVVTVNGKQINIDTKSRFHRDGTPHYNDILLELRSVSPPPDGVKPKAGWAVDPAKKTDYIAYRDTMGVCYLLPYELLRRTTLANGKKWIEKYGWRDANNGKYTTRNVPVPWDDLWAAMRAESEWVRGQK